MMRSPRWLIGVGVGLAALTIASPVSSNRFRDNPDRAVDRSVETWASPIGETESGPRDPLTGKFVPQFGTAIIVSPCYILTNYHVAYGDGWSWDVPPHTVIFRAGVSQNNAFLGHTVATAVLGGNFTIGGRNDWALMKLQSCIGRLPQFGWIDDSGLLSSQLRGRSVVAVGYPADVDRGQLRLAPGVVDDFDAKMGMWMFNSSTAPGESGGAILANVDGNLRLVGLNAGALVDKENPSSLLFDTYARGRANEFFPTADILNRADVKMILDADKAEFGRPNPALERQRMVALPR